MKTIYTRRAMMAAAAAAIAVRKPLHAGSGKPMRGVSPSSRRPTHVPAQWISRIWRARSNFSIAVALMELRGRNSPAAIAG